MGRKSELFQRVSSVPFTYDRNSHMFLSGEQQIPVSEFSPNELVDVDTRVDVADGLLAWGLFRPFVLPTMYDWMEQNLNDELLDETFEVVRESFESAHEQATGFEFNRGTYKRGEGALFGFEAQRDREYPHMTLGTIGNCACLGASYTGIPFGQSSWAEKIVAYEFHNADTPQQQNSLLAGLGHIAHRAAGERA